MTDAIEVLHYQTADGRIPFREWLDTVTDPVAYAAIQLRQDRLARGLFGDCEPVGEGVWELRIDTGAGYRVYYARSGKQVVLFLCGGDKRSQKSDIKTAKTYWRDYEQRTRSRSRSR
ncbi:MAG: type II toxin-antitoxin system RelE/ParE family toxin [Sulfuricaulis sp.]|nr:type II toxin-antitoxin system RelE/ParE family toxin [Sulfuricaulis sp.]